MWLSCCVHLSPACWSTPRAAALACDSAEIDKCDELYGRNARQGSAAQRQEVQAAQRAGNGARMERARIACTGVGQRQHAAAR